MTKEQREALDKIVELYNAGPICPRCEDRYPLSTKDMGGKLKCEVCGEDIIYGSEVAERLFESEVEKAKKDGWDKGERKMNLEWVLSERDWKDSVIIKHNKELKQLEDEYLKLIDN